MSKISVIVPVYKAEKFLNRCVESILAQTFTDFELILVDDGSPDACGKICDEYAKMDERVTVIHKVNGGVSSARNEGINIAKGDYLCFADSDDFVESDWLTNLYNAISQGFDLVSSAFKMVYKDYEKTEIISPMVNGTIKIEENNRFDKIFNLVFGEEKLYFSVCTKIFRSEIVKKHKIYFCETCENFAEDMAFVVEYLLYCDRIYCIDNADYCYHYCQNTASTMNTTKDMVMLNAMNEVSKHIAAHYLKVFGNYRFYPILYWEIMFNQYCRLISDKEKYADSKEELNKIKDKRWHKKWTKKLFFSLKKLFQIYGVEQSNKVLAVSHYFLHKNWKRFTYESAILYKMVKFYKKIDLLRNKNHKD